MLKCLYKLIHFLKLGLNNTRALNKIIVFNAQVLFNNNYTIIVSYYVSF